tara:strand:+ start:51 stop:284 length:234 start_codon:yes stop_codon:yes gene_type:complete
MIKIIITISLFFLLNHCSFDANSDLWDKKNSQNLKKKDKVIIKATNQNNEDLSNLTFEEIKEKLTKYGKNSDFPDIN